jgi:hypothetical protein
LPGAVTAIDDERSVEVRLQQQLNRTCLAHWTIARVTQNATSAAQECVFCAIVARQAEASVQTVFHFHLHVIPRYAGDGWTLKAESPHAPDGAHDECAHMPMYGGLIAVPLLGMCRRVGDGDVAGWTRSGREIARSGLTARLGRAVRACSRPVVPGSPQLPRRPPGRRRSAGFPAPARECADAGPRQRARTPWCHGPGP